MANLSMVKRRSLGERLRAGETLLLDAAMGTELHRRGVPTALPLWSALGLIDRPDIVRSIHHDDVAAGADIVTTNTFRTTRRMLDRAGRDAVEVVALNNLAVDLARDACRAAGQLDVLVAGSVAPLEDCYSPWLSPPFDVALAEHRDHTRLLAAAGVDFFLVETMPSAAEAEAALVAARETGLEATVGFVCGPDGRLLSGEELATAVARVEPHGPVAILVNCAAPPVIAVALAELRRSTVVATGGYANVGVVNATYGWAADAAITPEVYAAFATGWLELGARLVGGCCGTTPAHTAALRVLIDQVAGHGASATAWGR